MVCLDKMPPASRLILRRRVGVRVGFRLRVRVRVRVRDRFSLRVRVRVWVRGESGRGERVVSGER